MTKPDICLNAKTKTQISCALFSALGFATKIVKILFRLLTSKITSFKPSSEKVQAGLRQKP